MKNLPSLIARARTPSSVLEEREAHRQKAQADNNFLTGEQSQLHNEWLSLPTTQGIIADLVNKFEEEQSSALVYAQDTETPQTRKVEKALIRAKVLSEVLSFITTRNW